ncbi:MAG: plasmid partitioning protein RepB [Methylocystis sp.]
MARKNLLAGLTGALLPAGNSDAQSTTDARKPSAAAHLGVLGTRGAIGAVSRSIEQLKAHSVVDIAPNLIEPSFVSDRLETSEEHHRALVESIREHGQQIPVLVRPHPVQEGRYQIAYGRRRLLALAELGRNVRAIVKPLSDEQLVVAQGQENSARKDLTFIEKALFAARLEQSGYSRETIMAALTVDKTGLSRLISAAVKIPQDIIEGIGSAPSVGRDRWVELSTRLERVGALALARAAIAEGQFAAATSDSKFERVFAALAPKLAKGKIVRPLTLKAKDGVKFGNARDEPRTLTLVIDKQVAGGFARYLLADLPELYASFKKGEDVDDGGRRSHDSAGEV